MPKEAGELTQAIRRLLNDSNGSVTHSTARPLLIGMDFRLAPDPGKRPKGVTADEVKAMVSEYEIDYAKRGAFGEVMTALDIEDENLARAVADYMVKFIPFSAERNYFDVTKNNWKKQVTRVVSKRPEGEKNTKAVAAAKVSSQPEPAKTRGHKVAKTRGRRPSVVTGIGPISDVLATVEKMGGINAVQKNAAEQRAKAQELKAKADIAESTAVELEETVANFAALMERIKAAA